MVCPFVRKTITATHIAIVANVDTQRLNVVALDRICPHFVFKKQALFFQSFHVGQYLFNLLVRDVGGINILPFFFGFQIIGGGLVTFVQAAAAYVVNVIFISVRKYVNHTV